VTFVWPAEDGWPYPDPAADTAAEVADPASASDDDLVTLLALRSPTPHSLDRLEPLEREVLAARFGLWGHPIISMRQLSATTGRPRSEIKDALGSGLAKLRTLLS